MRNENKYDGFYKEIPHVDHSLIYAITKVTLLPCFNLFIEQFKKLIIEDF